MVALGDANNPILQSSDQTIKNGPGVTTASQFTTTKSTCSFISITAYEGNTEPMIVGGSGVKLGTLASAYIDRVGSEIIYPGQTKTIATPDPSLWYLSGLAADWCSWSILK